MSTRHDAVAERQLIALAMCGHPSIPEKLAELSTDHWFNEMHRTVISVIKERFTRGIPVDPITVAAQSADLTGTDDMAHRVRQFVEDCATNRPTLDAWEYYADELRKFYAIREGVALAVRLQEKLENARELDHIAHSIKLAREDIDTVEADTQKSVVEPPMSVAELLDGPEDPFDWLVPGLWERMDRFILTGLEGTGKSFLLAQIALCVAAGLHPFTGDLFNPDGLRVLVVDCENSKRQDRRRYRGIRQRVNLLREQHALPPVDWDTQCRILLRPDGFNIANLQEAARIERAITATAPDLVVAGPLYRMHDLNINDEQAAREITRVWDRWRVRYQFTMIAEAHVGHVGETGGGRKLRPTGSSLFLRWPEFGMGMRPFGPGLEEEHPSMVELVPWRGSRDERHWPRLLKHSDVLPWMPGNPDYYDMPPVPA